MIVRILGEGQWEVDRAAIADLNALDDEVDRAVSSEDQAELTAALARLLAEVRARGTQVPDAELRDSDLILPGADSTVEDVRSLLNPSGEGLIHG